MNEGFVSEKVCMINQYAFNISEISSTADVHDLFSIISDERRERISRFRFEKDKLHCLFAGVLLRYALWEKYGMRDYVIDKNDFGKPYLEDNKNVFFNLSHSGDWVILGLGEQNLGIDVEKMEDIDISIAEDFFADDECIYLSSLSEDERFDAFYTIWTLKESYTKNIGEGLSIPLDSFAIVLEPERIGVYVQGKRDDRFCFQTKNLDDCHKMALCVSAEENVMTDYTVLSIRDIFRFMDIFKCE